MHGDVVTVNIPIKVEYEHLEQRLYSAHRRTRANARDSVEELLAEPTNTRREYAVDGCESAVQIHVCGRKAEIPTEPQAANYFSGHRVVTPEHFFGAAQVARLEGRTNCGTTYAFFAHVNRWNRQHTEAVRPASRLQVPDRTESLRRETKIVTDDDLPRTEPINEQALDELVRSQIPDARKSRTEELIDAARSEQVVTLAKPGQAGGRIDRREELLTLLEEEPSISILVLGASVSGGGPGPIIDYLLSRGSSQLRVPVTLVPGSLSDEAIIAIT